MLSRLAIRMRPAVAGAVLVTGGALFVGGCSGSHNGGGAASAPTPQQAMVLAARHADVTHSVAATFSIRMGGVIGLTASGSMAEQNRPTLLAQLNFASMRMASQSLPGGMTEVLTDQGIYMKSSAFGPLADGRQWIEVRFRDLTRNSGINLGQIIQQAENSDPLAQTRMLAGATGVRKVGTGTIGGVPVTEYTGHFTIAQAIANLPASDRQSVQQQAAKAGLSGGSFTVWLDDQQRTRKLMLNEQGSSLNMSVTIVVTSINQPVSVQVPPASQVKVISLGSLGSGT